MDSIHSEVPSTNWIFLGFELHSDFLTACFALNQATCPALGFPSLPPIELEKRVKERLEKRDLSIEGGCSGAFKASLTKFMDKCICSASATRSTLGLPLDTLGGTDEAALELTAAHISGLTSRQLEVRFLPLTKGKPTGCRSHIHHIHLLFALLCGCRWILPLVAISISAFEEFVF